MATLKSLKTAYAELIDVLGLVDKKKKPLVIPADVDEDFLEEKIKEAIGLIKPEEDEFTKATQAVIDEFSEPEEEDEPEEDEPEEDEPEEDEPEPSKKPIAGKKPTPAGKKPVPTGKFKHENSYAAFCDDTILAGGTFEELTSILAKEIKKRGIKMSATPSFIKAHVAFRRKRNPKWLGKLRLTANGIE